MEKIKDIPPATFESVWAALQETDRILTEKFAETDRLFKESRIEFDKSLKESRAEYEQQRAEYERKNAEYEQKRAEYEQKNAESHAEYERNRAESNAAYEKSRAESNADFDRRMKKLEELTGSWANNHGTFAEEYFSNSFENGKQNFFGEKFDEMEKKVKGIKKGYKDEYDILLINGESVGIVEIKFKGHTNDIPKILKKAETFRVNFPEYANHRVYLGMASMAFYSELEQECINQGIAVVKQVGETVVINDAHLKVF